MGIYIAEMDFALFFSYTGSVSASGGKERHWFQK